MIELMERGLFHSDQAPLVPLEVSVSPVVNLSLQSVCGREWRNAHHCRISSLLSLCFLLLSPVALSL